MARAAAGLDRAVTLAVRAGTPGPENDAAPHGHEARVRALRDLVARCSALGTDKYFPNPRSIDPVRRALGGTRGRERTDLTWPSQIGTFLPEMAERYQRTLENRVAVARLFSRAPPRPVAILVHGYMCGQLALEYALVSAIRYGLRRAGTPPAEIERFSREALSAQDPRRLEEICQQWVLLEQPQRR
jgi:hypothetical protein